jgi:hypothetical protein
MGSTLLHVKMACDRRSLEMDDRVVELVRIGQGQAEVIKY